MRANGDEMAVKSSAAILVGMMLVAFVACTSTVVGTGNPPPGNGSSSSTTSTSGGATSSTSGTTGGSGAACATIEGVWDVGGNCGAGATDTCTITQSNCDIDLQCKGSSFSGQVDGDTFTYSGVTAQGYDTTCSGRVVSTRLATGSCDVPGEPRCSFSASKK